MEWLNFHHLRYFHVVAREGSIARAGEVLHTSQPAISTQLRQLEQALGEKLFQRQGRGLSLTEAGRLVQGYAEQIFGLGRELLDAVRDRPTGAPLRVQIGVCDAVPKDLSFRLLEPLLRGPERSRVVVHEDRAERLLAALATFELDLVIADGPIATGSRVKAFHHPLGESAIGVFGRADRVKALRGTFPASLRGAPFLLPLPDSELRRAFDIWARDHDLAPDLVAEVEDDALLRSLASAGHGFVLAPTVLGRDLAATAKLAKVAEVPGVRVRYMAVTVARRVDNPAVVRLLAGARDKLFA
ncbi:MAG: LysR family transcriptional regulator [Planctomycetes bacterium]|nr:LysR family transcriptional regulator [Planctomycetota bacterium]